MPPPQSRKPPNAAVPQGRRLCRVPQSSHASPVTLPCRSVRAKLSPTAERWPWGGLAQRQARAGEPKLTAWPVKRPAVGRGGLDIEDGRPPGPPVHPPQPQPAEANREMSDDPNGIRLSDFRLVFRAFPLRSRFGQQRIFLGPPAHHPRLRPARTQRIDDQATDGD